MTAQSGLLVSFSRDYHHKNKVKKISISIKVWYAEKMSSHSQNLKTLRANEMDLNSQHETCASAREKRENEILNVKHMIFMYGVEC